MTTDERGPFPGPGDLPERGPFPGTGDLLDRGPFPGPGDLLDRPVIRPEGFREYDARWRFPEEIDLAGMTALGLGLGAQMAGRGLGPDVVVGSDYRAYAPAARHALMLGLVRAGARVLDIGTTITPAAYFAQGRLGAAAVAMVTASHNPNGWTGLKAGFAPPLTHGPEEMEELARLALGGGRGDRPGGRYERVEGMAGPYLDDLAAGGAVGRRLRVVCATGNGGAGAFAPALLARLGIEVIGRHVALDHGFPHYNPNPEALAMLDDMGRAVRAAGADLGLGFDGDGDRCGVVDGEGREVFADKVGVLIARDLAPRHPGATIVADVKSTGLFATDPVLRAHGIRADYAPTGHSHMKRRVHALGALAGFEKSGHAIFAPPLGRGYDDALRLAVEICRLLDRSPAATLADLACALPPSWPSPTMSPACPDGEKYAVAARITARLEALARAGGTLAGRAIDRVVTVNGARVILEGGGWGLVRASSNTPNLVVVCESFASPEEMRRIFAAIDALIRAEPAVGDYDQRL